MTHPFDIALSAWRFAKARDDRYELSVIMISLCAAECSDWWRLDQKLELIQQEIKARGQHLDLAQLLMSARDDLAEFSDILP